VPLSDDQRKHLEFIQAVITRLASSSAAAKGWGLTVATATFGFSAAKAVPFVAILGLVVILCFAVVDAHYLREERLFRELYNEARTGSVDLYSMDKDRYAWTCTRRQVLCSWSVAGFYTPLVVVGVAAFFWSMPR
jgi:histidine triad (HIT) family protein